MRLADQFVQLRFPHIPALIKQPGASHLEKGKRRCAFEDLSVSLCYERATVDGESPLKWQLTREE